MASPKFNKEMIADAINQELLDSISLMMGVREKKDAKRGTTSEVPKDDGSETVPLHEPETAEGVADKKVNSEGTQRTSSLDLHLKMIEEQNSPVKG